MVKELKDFFLAEGDGQFVRTPRPGEVLIAPRHFQRYGVDTLQCGHALVDRFRRILPVVEEVELKLANVLQIQFLRAEPIVAGETGYVIDIVSF